MVSRIDDQDGQRSPRRFIKGFVGVGLGITVLLGLFFILAYGLTDREARPGPRERALVGLQAPMFQSSLIKGGEFDLNRELGQPIVLNFWASWCPPCRVELPMLQELHAAGDNRANLTVVGVNIQDTRVQAQQLLESSGLTFPNVYDGRGHIAVMYGVVSLPLTFFIDSQGVIVGKSAGFLTKAGLNAQVQALAAADRNYQETVR